MISSIPRNTGRKYCKVCAEKTGKRVWMEDLGDRIRCPNCGREVKISDAKPRPFLRSVDPVRLRTAGGIRGERKAEDDIFSIHKAQTRKVPGQSVGRYPLKAAGETFSTEESYRIIITLPYHKDITDVQWEITDGVLIVESLLPGFNFREEYQLPEDVSVAAPRIAFKNGILEINFETIYLPC